MDRTTRSLLLRVGFALAPALLICALAFAQGTPNAIVSAATGSDNVVDVNVQVSSLGTKKWRDIHFKAPKSKKFPKVVSLNGMGSTQTSVTDSDGENGQTWNVSSREGGNQLHVYTGTSGSAPEGFGNGLYQFQLKFKDGKGSKTTGLTWKVTTDGAEYAGSGGVHGEDDDGDDDVEFPLYSIAINGDDPMTVSTGGTRPVPAAGDTTLGGQPYQIYTSLSLNEGYEDDLAIGINNETDPVPGSWGLTFNNFTGVTDAGGNPVNPTITIPADPTLNGRIFYVVYVVKDVLPEGGIDASSYPIAVTITHQ